VNVDVLVISAHPDDAELACSGTVKKLTNQGFSVAFVDCSRGESGTRGNVDLRADEARKAQEILGVLEREILDMPDGLISAINENVLKLVTQIRRFQPRLMIIPPPRERHPDHEAVHNLSRTAAFSAGLQKVSTQYKGEEQVPFRPHRLICYQLHYDFPGGPDFYVDISDTYQEKMASVRAFASQFHAPDEYESNDPHTFISSKSFLEELEARARYFGGRIGTRYAEAYLLVEPLGLSSLSLLL